ncbi:MAG TPA: hypothetical protein VFP89_15865 [Propionibacteriaceae bacterium]|nr:hypothetical protein [Propionibacteriaceae bacterium]
MPFAVKDSIDIAGSVADLARVFVVVATTDSHDPWVAKRLVEFGDFVHQNPTSVLPVIAEIINGGARFQRRRCLQRTVPAG